MMPQGKQDPGKDARVLFTKAKNSNDRDSTCTQSGQQTAKCSPACRSRNQTGQSTECPVAKSNVMQTPATAVCRLQLTQDTLLPAEIKNISEVSLIRLLRSQMDVLHEEYSSLQNSFKKQSVQLMKLQNSNRQADEMCLQFKHCVQSLKDRMKIKEEIAAQALKQCAYKDMEIHSLRREVERLKQELRVNRQEQKTYEMKLDCSVKEKERLELALKNLKIDVKGRLDFNQKNTENYIVTMQKLENQNLELSNAIKKQMQLVNSLRKQMVQCAASEHRHFSESHQQRVDLDPGNANTRDNAGASCL